MVFCMVSHELQNNGPDWCTIVHTKEARTKSSLAYEYWKETGDLPEWKGIAQVAIVKNPDDLLLRHQAAKFVN